jgi:hypothetical protein
VVQVQTYGESLHVIVDSAEKRIPEIRVALEKQELAYRSMRTAPVRMEEAFISLIDRLEAEEVK